MTPETRKAIEQYINTGYLVSSDPEYPCTWLRECLDEIERLREAVTWYGEIAHAINRFMTKPFKLQAVEAALSELSIDKGRRAVTALTEKLSAKP